jgi:hypothetical protein
MTFLIKMPERISFLLFLFLLAGCSDQPADVWDVEKLNEIERYGTKIGTSSFLLITDGEIVKQWGDVTAPSKVHSVRKSILNALEFALRQAESPVEWIRGGNKSGPGNPLVSDQLIDHYQNVHLNLEQVSRLFPKDAGSQELAGYMSDGTVINKTIYYLYEAKRSEELALNEIRRTLIR